MSERSGGFHSSEAPLPDSNEFGDGGESAIVEANVVDAPVIDVNVASPTGQPCGACGCPNEPGDHFCVACGTPLSERTQANGGISQTASADAGVEIVAAEIVATESPGSGSPTLTSAPRNNPTTPTPPQKYFRCETCGAEVSTSVDQRSYVCAFCDSTYVVEFGQDQSGRQPPEFVIGFAVTVEQAKAKFAEWIQANGWFRPGDLKSGRLEGKQKGVYLPFWTFSGLAQSEWAANIGQYWYKTERYTTTQNGKTVTRTRRVKKTEWWPLHGRHHAYHNGYLISASKGLPQEEAKRIQPFQLPALKRYEPFYLAGWLCEEYCVAREEARQLCQEEFDRREQARITAFLPGDTSQGLRTRTTYSQVQSDLILLPCYILSYRYQDKVYRFLVNGQTGRCAGDKPVSWPRIWTASGIGVLLVILFVLLFIYVANI